MQRVDPNKRKMALESGIPDGYEEVPEGEYVDDSCWYLDRNGGMRKGDLKDMTGAFRYCKQKHQVIIRPTEAVMA